jgi:hypothetical protein
MQQALFISNGSVLGAYALGYNSSVTPSGTYGGAGGFNLVFGTPTDAFGMGSIASYYPAASIGINYVQCLERAQYSPASLFFAGKEQYMKLTSQWMG